MEDVNLFPEQLRMALIRQTYYSRQNDFDREHEVYIREIRAEQWLTEDDKKALSLVWEQKPSGVEV